MIVKKILKNNQYVPDLPEGLVYESCTLNLDGETYTIKGLKEINGVPVRITTLQGKLQLINMDLLDKVEEIIYSAGSREKVYWEYAINWERSNPIINGFAAAIGMTQEELDSFFIEASKLS
jgi:hypothetical protein